jgi:glycosyltransferase involved in cell wall biosynthesis
MRIAIIAPPWVPIPPPAYGGTELVVDLLARGLQAEGHEVLLFAAGDSTCPVPRGFVHEHALGTTGPPSGEKVHVRHAYGAARGFDIVHDHTLVGPLYSERIPDLPVVATNHGPFLPHLRDHYRSVTPRVKVIAISRAHAASARDVPIARVIHHGIDVDRMAFNESPDDYFLFLGRMSPDKGAHRAARIARAAGVPLRIAAKLREPAEFEYFDTHVKPLLSGDIEYVGELGGSAKRDALAGARALLNPISWEEPFGLVMAEALASGTPVLAFPRGAAPEIVEHGVTGYLCHDERSMARRIAEVDRLDRKCCRVEAETRFSASRMVAEHVELYRELATGRRAAA